MDNIESGEFLPSGFFENSWEKDYCIFESPLDSRVSGAFVLDDVEALLRFAAPAKEVECLFVYKGIRIVESSLRRSSGEFDVDKVLRHYETGATIRPRFVEKYSERVRRILAHLASETSCIGHVNAYITPGGSYAFKPHFDPYNVFVLQVEGRKRWQVWSPRQVLSSETFMPSFDMSQLGEPSEEFDLEEGQVLYIPRGMAHAASTPFGENSTHLTVGLRPLLWDQLIKMAVEERMTKNDAFRSNVFSAVGASCHSNCQTLKERIDLLMREIAIEDVEASVQRWLSETKRTIPEKSSQLADLRDLEEINEFTCIQKFDNDCWRLTQCGDCIQILSSSCDLKINLKCLSALESLRSGKKIKVADLLSPGESLREKCLFARYLAANGLVWMS